MTKVVKLSKGYETHNGTKVIFLEALKYLLCWLPAYLLDRFRFRDVQHPESHITDRSTAAAIGNGEQKANHFRARQKLLHLQPTML